MTKTTHAYLHIHDEFRGIPCGVRHCEIKRKGETVYIRPVGIIKRRWNRMPVKRFNETFGKEVLA